MQDSQNSTYTELSNLIYIEGLAPFLAAMLLCIACGASNHPIGTSVIANKYLDTLETTNEKIQWIEYVRSGIVKSSVICGIPRAINTQTSLFNGISKEYQTLLKKTPVINQNQDNWDLYGASLLHLVYGEESDNISYTLNDSGPDLWFWIKQVYGNLYSETTYLDYVDTELNIIVSLIQMGALTQLDNHLKGAKNVGATAEQIKAAEFIGCSVRDAFK